MDGGCLDLTSTAAMRRGREVPRNILATLRAGAAWACGAVRSLFPRRRAVAHRLLQTTAEQLDELQRGADARYRR